MSGSFFQLTPDVVLHGCEALGLLPTGRVIQLNSYENRVFDVELEDKSSIIVKYYRPNRWSKDAILDEHHFLSEIHMAGFKTGPPLSFSDATLFEQSDLYWAAFKKIRGRMPQEILTDDLKRIGTALGHLHNLGASSKAPHRPSLTVSEYALPAIQCVQNFLVPELKNRYLDAAQTLTNKLQRLLPKHRQIRIHGDAHRGNILDDGNEIFFVDFDDFCNGPVAQDLWMLLSSHDADEKARELDALIEGYEKIRLFDESELELFEPLRGLRMLHYSGWIARRWSDPSFPRLFPDFKTFNYWSEETEALEKIAWGL